MVGVIIIIILLAVFFPSILFIGGGIGAVYISIVVVGAILLLIYDFVIGNKKKYKKIIIDKGYNNMSESELLKEYNEINYKKALLGLPVGKGDSDDWKRRSYSDLLEAINFELKLRKKNSK